jgi:hypothetical protein
MLIITNIRIYKGLDNEEVSKPSAFESSGPYQTLLLLGLDGAIRRVLLQEVTALVCFIDKYFVLLYFD